MDGVYLTWLISALAVGVFAMPYFKPPWANMTLSGFVDFIRRYWLHLLLALSIYNAKDFLDQIDRIFMARTGIDMTPYIYAIEGDLVVWVQETFRADWLDSVMTHFYISGFMFITYASIFYVAYFDDRWMADRIALCIAWVYILAIPFYLFFNVRVTGFYIEDMDAIAYTLNPEIETWFRRIDAFTNCMPSLHIAVPFSIWLTFRKHDHDGRWKRFQNMTLIYIIVTAFAIVYLGIHWFSDIIGGMMIGALTVKMVDKSNTAVWNVLDERTINSRLATILTRPIHSLKFVFNRSKKFTLKLLKPTSKETGAMIVIVLILTAGVITWDLTNKDLPAEGVQSAQGAVASDGWLATLDNQSGVAVVLVHNLSLTSDDAIDVIQPTMDVDSLYALKKNYLVMANESEIMLVDLNKPNQPLIVINQTGVNGLELTDLQGEPVIIYTSNNQIQAVNTKGQDIVLPMLPAGQTIEMISVQGNELVMISKEMPSTVQIGTIGISGTQNIFMNATSSEEQDLKLEEWGLIVDYQNATITDIAFNENYIATIVNVSAINRLVLYDRGTVQQSMPFDAKFPINNISMGYEYLVWEGRDHLDPTNLLDQYFDWEIHQYNLETKISEQLTSDSVNQYAPIVVEEGIVYLEEGDDGELVVKVLTRGTDLAKYSSIVLQFAVMVLIVLTFIFIIQRQDEEKKELLNHDIGHESE
ncbi:phosphatase PAP2 family protein [Candidatus Poseidoniales archaeon]|nr:phosphatase PAP2 family protein [Candidatus Poseidoniales archaeon]MDC3317443.1 phosphatase PAP2 family protein [Candidatus Poseidoniaceae archaeon]